jgi:hypothetical protein
MSENLLTYTEVDPNSRVTLTADRATHATMTRNDSATYTSKDLGAGAIVEATTLNVILYHDSSTQQSAFCNHVIWSNANKSWNNLNVDGDKAFYQQDGRNATGYYTAIAQLNLGGGFDLGYYAANTARLLKISRSGNTYTGILYNGTTVGSGVKDTLTFSPVDTVPTSFRYNTLAANSDDSANSATHAGYAEFYTFSGLVLPPAKGLMGGGFVGQETLMGGGIEI